VERSSFELVKGLEELGLISCVRFDDRGSLPSERKPGYPEQLLRWWKQSIKSAQSQQRIQSADLSVLGPAESNSDGLIEEEDIGVRVPGVRVDFSVVDSLGSVLN
jgi:hypothetical protein